MVISHEFKFIFVKTAKTAGTSIEVFLSGQCPDSDIFTPIFPEVASHRARNHEAGGFYNHMPAREIRSRVTPDIWESYFKFCVERNPWDKTLSHYHMQNYRAGGKLSLEDYFKDAHFPHNYPKYTDADGAIIVDRILKYEYLEQELADVFGMLGIPFSGTLDVYAKSEYREDRRPYREVLTPDQARIIATEMAREIELHSYKY